MKRTLAPALLILLLLLAGCTGQSTDTAAKDIPLDDILQSIRDAYGEDYLPTAEIPAEMLENEFGLIPDLYVEAKGEEPMMSAHPDRVVVVRAVEGKADDVEAAFNAARERKINDELQYPVNIAKTNATQIVRSGDYVAFLLVGAPLPSDVDSDAEAAQFARDETAKAVDAFHAHFA